MKILLLEPIHPDAHRRLAEAGQVFLVENPADAVHVASEEEVQAVVTRGRGTVRRPFIEACASLQVIARVGVGVDNVDVDAATEHGVLVLNAPGSTTQAVAEHTMLLLMGLVRRVYPILRAVKAGDWASRQHYRGDELTGKTLGLLGMGAIGQRVAELAEAFGMRVAYWSRRAKDVPYAYRSLPDLLAEADVVSVHVALTPETRHLLDHTRLATMKPGALLINTARGGVIDQEALVAMLDDGPLGGFAADVLDVEPPDPADPLLGRDDVLLTPHVAALTETTFRAMSLRTAANTLAALRGEAFDAACIVNPGYRQQRGA